MLFRLRYLQGLIFLRGGETRATETSWCVDQVLHSGSSELAVCARAWMRIGIPSGAMYVYEMSGIFDRDDVSVENKKAIPSFRDANLRPSCHGNSRSNG